MDNRKKSLTTDNSARANRKPAGEGFFTKEMIPAEFLADPTGRSAQRDHRAGTATSISIVHRRPTWAICVAVAASSVRSVAPARSPMARTIPDPTDYIPGSSKRPARSRSSRISRQSDRRVTTSASSSVTNSVTTGITQARRHENTVRPSRSPMDDRDRSCRDLAR